MRYVQVSDVWLDFSEYNFVETTDPTEMYMHYVTIKQADADSSLVKSIDLNPEQKKKRRLLFIAGFGSSGASYFEIFKELHKHFEVHIPDILGFGSSGRPEFLCQTTEETAEYFVVCLRKWMDKTGFDKEGPYSIMAHSLGCWAASFFAIRYPENIQQFMFISPACMSRPKPDFCPEAFIRG